MAALQTALASVTGIVAIGWRGGEQHFLDLIRASLRPNVSAFVVTEKPEASMATTQALMAAGVADVRAFSEGFSGLMKSDMSGLGNLRAFVVGQVFGAQTGT
jgi:hypothetical protein